MKQVELVYLISVFVGIIIVYWNIVASIALVKTDELEKFQKVVQGALVWLVPILGSFVVIRLISEYDLDAFRSKFIPEIFQGWIGRAHRSQERADSREESLNEHFSPHDSAGGGD
ncbi:MAG: hypothetical protein COB04_11420 [Gammaproteobacteria bacterium]|nr:MAG: hypothetical protein COB04_11420 [Gammaproteobacteria bacterium]